MQQSLGGLKEQKTSVSSSVIRYGITNMEKGELSQQSSIEMVYVMRRSEQMKAYKMKEKKKKVMFNLPIKSQSKCTETN